MTVSPNYTEGAHTDPSLLAVSTLFGEYDVLFVGKDFGISILQAACARSLWCRQPCCPASATNRKNS